jgi:hypothetical protein
MYFSPKKHFSFLDFSVLFLYSQLTFGQNMKKHSVKPFKFIPKLFEFIKMCHQHSQTNSLSSIAARSESTSTSKQLIYQSK